MTDGIMNVIAVDVLALSYQDGALRLGLIERDAEPYAGARALPGVAMRTGERMHDAALRALSKLTDKQPTFVAQLRTFDEPSRDPRGPALSIAMVAVVSSLDVAGSVDLGSATWARMFDDLPGLAFDHEKIVQECGPVLRRMLLSDLLFTKALLPTHFTASDVANIMFAFDGRKPHLPNVNRVLDAMPNVARVNEASRAPGRGRPRVKRRINI